MSKILDQETIFPRETFGAVPAQELEGIFGMGETTRVAETCARFA